MVNKDTVATYWDSGHVWLSNCGNVAEKVGKSGIFCRFLSPEGGWPFKDEGK